MATFAVVQDEFHKAVFVREKQSAPCGNIGSTCRPCVASLGNAAGCCGSRNCPQVPVLLDTDLRRYSNFRAFDPWPRKSKSLPRCRERRLQNQRVELPVFAARGKIGSCRMIFVPEAGTRPLNVWLGADSCWAGDWRLQTDRGLQYNAVDAAENSIWFRNGSCNGEIFHYKNGGGFIMFSSKIKRRSSPARIPASARDAEIFPRPGACRLDCRRMKQTGKAAA